MHRVYFNKFHNWSYWRQNMAIRTKQTRGPPKNSKTSSKKLKVQATWSTPSMTKSRRRWPKCTRSTPCYNERTKTWPRRWSSTASRINWKNDNKTWASKRAWRKCSNCRRKTNRAPGRFKKWTWSCLRAGWSQINWWSSSESSWSCNLERSLTMATSRSARRTPRSLLSWASCRLCWSSVSSLSSLLRPKTRASK